MSEEAPEILVRPLENQSTSSRIIYLQWVVTRMYVPRGGLRGGCSVAATNALRRPCTSSSVNL